MREAISVLALGTGLLLCSCVDHPIAFPANDLAQAAGNITVDATMYGAGAGPITFHMPDGESLTGRYSVLYGGSVGFGSVYGSVYGTGGSASGSAFSTMGTISRTNPAMADAAGPKTTIHCEVLLSALTGHGNGACKTLTGALYRVQF